jgi:uncharacterized membrane protein
MQKSLPNPVQNQPKTQTNGDGDAIQGEVVPFEVLKPSDGQNGKKFSFTGIALVRSHVGPLPSPDNFREYENAVPGSGMRIIGMAECEQKHRHEQESRTTMADIGLQYLGLIGTIALAGFGIWKGSALIEMGRGSYGLAVIGTSLTGVLTLIIRAIIVSRTSKSNLQSETPPQGSANGNKKRENQNKNNRRGNKRN